LQILVYIYFQQIEKEIYYFYAQIETFKSNLLAG